MLSIVTNVSSLQAQNYLLQTENNQNTTIQQVTSGLRIVNSGVDAAGLAIANSDRSNEAVLTQGVQNASNAQSELQIADGGLSNISQLLDRARTLATESASGSFTGDRSVLNDEFQSVIQEVNRQAQSIGLNTGGSLAQNLGVFVGGGQSSNGISAAENGTVNVNLAGATVDAQSLGLQGVQAVNTSGANLADGQNTSVQAIVNDTNNQQPNNETTFNFSGPGFSSPVAVSVNLSGVTDTNTLVTAINNAIQSAGNGTTAAATAFANAGITASVVTDPSGGQHIAFSSSSAAFQVQAGDKMANALMGNTTSAASPDGAAIASTVTGSANTAASGNLGTNTTLSFSGGGMTSPVTISLASGSSLSSIQSQINSNTALQSAGISLTTATAGSKLVFSDSQGQQFNVQAAGDTANYLGLGSFEAGSSGAVQYNTITAGAAYNAATSTGTANLEFSINGGPGTNNQLSLAMNGGDATSGSATGTVDLTAGIALAAGTNVLTVAIDGGAADTITLGTTGTESAAALVNAVQTAIGGAGTASLANSGGHTYLQVTSASTGTTSSVVFGGDGAATFVGASPTTANGQSRSIGNIVSTINTDIAGNSALQAAGLTATDNGGKLEITSNNNTNFSLNAYGTGNLGFGVTGGVAYGAGNVSSEAGFTAENAGGAYQTGDIGFTGLANGNDKQSITISAVDSTGTTQSLTVQLQNNNTSQNGSNIDSTLSAINNALQKSDIGVLQGITAVKDNVSGTQEINFLSTQGFNVAVGTTADGTGVQSQGTTQSAAVVGAQTTANISTVQSATDAVNQLANSVQILGNAQAAVGRGENLMNYATNLANSQLTNTQAAESGIRDVDMAQASANLTQSQIQLQAGIAALAQANSAPQQVLSLLQH